MFCGLLVSIAPAGIVSRLLTDSDLQLKNPSGSVWDGHAEAQYQSKQLGVFRWDVHALELFTGELSTDYELSGQNLELGGHAIYSSELSEATLAGSVDAPFINMYTRPYDIRLSGTFNFEDVQLRVYDVDQLRELSGTITWDGGPVVFKLSNIVYDVSLQPVYGILSNQANVAILSVYRTVEADMVMELQADLDSGWVKIKAFPPFLEFAQVPSGRWVGRVASMVSDSDFLFEVSQKVF